MSITNPAFPDDVHLLDREEYQTSEEFKNTHIRPRIMQDWYANNAFLLTELVNFSERFRPTLEVSTHWHSLLSAQQSADHTEALSSVERYTHRVLRVIEDFHCAVEYAERRQKEKQAKRAAEVAAYESKLKGNCIGSIVFVTCSS